MVTTPQRRGLNLLALGHANRWVLYGGAAVIVVGGGLIYRAATKHNVAIPASDIYTVGYGSVVQTISASGTVERNNFV